MQITNTETPGTLSAVWEPMRTLCRRLVGDLDAVTPLITQQIRLAEPRYEAVAIEEHEADVRQQMLLVLEAIDQARLPSPVELALAADLGRRRAAAGVPLHAVIGAYHVGHREIWRLVRQRAGSSTDLLPDVAALMWESVQRVCAAIAQAHGEVTWSLNANQITLWHRFIDLLNGEQFAGETEQLATAIGFSPSAAFIAAAIPIDGRADAGLNGVREALEQIPGTVIGVGAQNRLLVLGQPSRLDDMIGSLRQLRARGPLALGMWRDGLHGAALSLQDATRLLAVTPSDSPFDHVRRFEENWLHATLLAEHVALRSLVAGRLPVVRANPHLAQAVLAFADNDMSTTSAARALNVHSNTATYRLNRWQALTGLDPKTFEGLSLSLLACWLSQHPDDTNAAA